MKSRQHYEKKKKGEMNKEEGREKFQRRMKKLGKEKFEKKMKNKKTKERK